MDRRLELLVTAGINAGLSIREINKGLKALAKHPSLQKLQVGISIDQKAMQSINEFNNGINKMTQATEQQKASAESYVDTLNKEAEQIKKITQAQREWNLEQQKTYKDAHGKVTGTTSTYGAGNTKQIVNRAPDGAVTSMTDIENQKKDLADYNKLLNEAYRMNEAFNKKAEALDKAHYQALKTNKAKAEAMDKMHYTALRQNRERDLQAKNAQLKQAEGIDRAHFMALRTNQERKEAADKLHYLALEQNRQRDLKLQQQYNSIKNSMEVQSVGLLNHPRVRKPEVNAIMSEMDSLNKSRINPQDIERARDLQQQFKMIGVEARGAAVSTNTFAGAFRNALVKFPIWMAASTAFFGVIRGIRSSLDNIVAIDTEMTVLRRVMDGSTDFNAMLKNGISISNELGKSLKDTMEAMTGFARQGFDESQVAHLTKTSQLMTNISELNAEDSMSTMTSAMTIFNIEASKSIKIVDMLNEVDNSFALTTEQLSASLRKAGSTAVAFGKLNAA